MRSHRPTMLPEILSASSWRTPRSKLSGSQGSVRVRLLVREPVLDLRERVVAQRGEARFERLEFLEAVGDGGGVEKRWQALLVTKRQGRGDDWARRCSWPESEESRSKGACAEHGE